MASEPTLVANLTARLDQFEKEMRRAGVIAEREIGAIEQKTSHRASSVGGVIGTRLAVALGTAIGVALSRQSIAAVADIGRLAEQIGISSDLLQKYGGAAHEAGVSTRQLGAAMLRLTREIGESDGKINDFVLALADLGLRQRDLAKLSPDEQFKRVVDALARVTNATKQAALANKLLGESGQRLLPVIRRGADEMLRMSKITPLPPELIKKAEEADIEFTRLGEALRNTGAAVSVGMLPALKELRELMSDPAFLAGAKAIGETIADLIRKMVENKETVLAVVGALAGFRLGRIAGPVGGLAGAVIGGAAGLGIAEKTTEAAREATQGLTVDVEKLQARVTALRREYEALGQVQRTSAPVAAPNTGPLKAHNDELARLAVVARGAQEEVALLQERERQIAETVAHGMIDHERMKEVGRSRLQNAFELKAAEEALLIAKGDVATKEDEIAQLQNRRGASQKAALGVDEKSNQAAARRLEIEKEMARIEAQIRAAGRAPVAVDVGKAPPSPEFPEIEAAMQRVIFQTRILKGEFSGLSEGFPELVFGFERTRAAIVGFSGAVTALPPQLQALNAAMAQQAQLKAAGDAWKFFGNEVVGALDKMIFEGAKFEDVMRAMLRSVTRELLRALITGEGVFGKLLGLAGPGGSAGGIFGLLKDIKFLAGGGPAVAGRGYVVGERGPELFVPSRSGTVVPNAVTSRTTRAGNVMNFYSSIDARGADQAAVVRIERAQQEAEATFSKRVGNVERTRRVRRMRY